MIPSDLLHIVGWNVLGIGRRDLGRFCDDVAKVIDWGVLLRQEFGAHKTHSMLVDGGHEAFISPAVPGMRALAILNSKI